MIIANRDKEHLHQSPGRRFWVLGLLLVAIITTIAVLLQRHASQNQSQVISCDAERVRSNHFIGQGGNFSKGDLRSSDRAKSGQYACKAPKGQGAQYGFGYQMTAPEPGRSFRVSVWRFKNQYQEGKLALKVSGEVDFYLETDQISSQDNGWEELTLRFTLPFGKKADRVDIYVYTNGFHRHLF
jgi:hypothetical protein